MKQYLIAPSFGMPYRHDLIQSTSIVIVVKNEAAEHLQYTCNKQNGIPT